LAAAAEDSVGPNLLLLLFSAHPAILNRSPPRRRPSAFANLRFVERCLACEADFQRVAMLNRRLWRTSCPRIRSRGVMECRSVGVLRQIRNCIRRGGLKLLTRRFENRARARRDRRCGFPKDPGTPFIKGREKQSDAKPPLGWLRARARNRVSSGNGRKSYAQALPRIIRQKKRSRTRWQLGFM
jgi:hypothetical protein